VILIGAFVMLAVIGIVCAWHFSCRVYATMSYLGGMLCVAIAVGLACSVAPQQQEQKAVVELHGDLVQLLKLADARKDPVFSADVRAAMAQTIGKVNEAVADAKASNDGLLDIWYSDVLAANKPLR
jgi:hypothetical protein